MQHLENIIYIHPKKLTGAHSEPLRQNVNFCNEMANQNYSPMKTRSKIYQVMEQIAELQDRIDLEEQRVNDYLNQK